jgi:CubicO group peptidase (beta-lactamase class C family)
VFDLASLTKVLATTALIIERVDQGELDIDSPVAAHIPGWQGADRRNVTLRDLLSHCAGLPAHAKLFLRCHDAAAFEEAICAIPLDYAPRSAAVYSDLGFILLGFLLARDVSLPEQFDRLLSRIKVTAPLRFLPPTAWREHTAPTGIDPWRERLLVGEVHDQNAWGLGGAAGHAGLFGTAAAVGAFSRHLVQILDGEPGALSREQLRAFTTRPEDIPGSSRALGWDTMLETSSCGSRISERAFGHLGFTGTSLWIDPDRAAYLILLTNRVHPTPDGPGLKTFRPAFHDAVIDALDMTGSNRR